MTIALLALVAAPCIAAIFHGVYIDHVRQQRLDRCRAVRRTCAEQRQIRREALRPIGGSFGPTQEAR